MLNVQHERLLASLQDEVEKAKEAFDVAKQTLYRDMGTVRDVGYSNPDGATLWHRSTARYNKAVEQYGDALHKLAEALTEEVPSPSTLIGTQATTATNITVGRYRLRSPTIALENRDGRPISIRLPEGATLIVEERPPEGQFVDCSWDSVRVRLFIVDLLNRGERC